MGALPAVRAYSLLEASGQGQAAIAYVRALVNAGVAVHWTPLDLADGVHLRPLLPDGLARVRSLAEGDAALADLEALLAATSTPLEPDVVFAHLPPEHWPTVFLNGRRNVGYVAWEADRVPAHWLPVAAMADAVAVPCEMNVRAFAGCGRPVHVVPHVRRHRWNESSPAELDALRRGLGLPDGAFVFYTIGTWDLRKNMPGLLEAFGRAFGAGDPVALVVKAGPVGEGPGPLHEPAATAALAQAAMADIVRKLGRATARVCLLPQSLTGREIDQLHEIGDAYVSLSHGEGWGLGAFDAAARGTPVLIPAWGGPADFLGASGPHALPYALGPAPLWPPYRPAFWPHQRWAHPDLDAACEAMRHLVRDPAAARAAAFAAQDRIANRYAEPVVARRLLEVLRG
jgi:glycosyltransferase involved in cell wall biosynthesis